MVSLIGLFQPKIFCRNFAEIAEKDRQTRVNMVKTMEGVIIIN
jgi:hypothetical protein